MSKYNQAAIRAVELIHQNINNSPGRAWEIATAELFGEGTWGAKKGCPKNAFLGLCEEGYVKGVSTGIYNSRKNLKNKGYVIKALSIVQKQPDLLDDKKKLWNQVTEGNRMSHNYQLNVLEALWKSNYIQI
ncbi:hypothetical protein C0Q44_26280 [Paenibacillus sp. PCH8]|uniref:DUF6979 family protein n=1 Tax=Paenibacillus sp. PCH8 TaxID=2066524 RepID=UPI000CF8E490|nr:hypothetical protein [Paenibacillus sp. PCH8]PQP80737.1 hypothetical protein C0Q44_26280 [Paenibacillus sp. PCH8]